MRRLVLCLLLLPSLSAVAAPSGADLLAACGAWTDKGADLGAQQLCYWYVTPCDCDYLVKQGLPKVCLPESSTELERAGVVVEGLRQVPALQTESATVAATTILAERYPCPN